MSNKLVIGSTGTSTSFLSEADLPKHARLTQKPSEIALQDIEDMEINNAIQQSKTEQPGCSKPLPPTPIGFYCFLGTGIEYRNRIASIS